jgi:hypothetical protein
MTTDLPELPEANLISQGLLTPTQVEQYGIAYSPGALHTRAGLLVAYFNEPGEKHE